MSDFNETVKNIAQSVHDSNSTTDQFAVSQTPFHTHNGRDSQRIPFIGLSDVPMSYWQDNQNNTAGFSVMVNASATGLEFSPIYSLIQSYAPVAGGTVTLNLSASNYHRIQMPAGNITIVTSGGRRGQCFIIDITQDSSGSRTVTWFSGINWAGGSPPTLTTTASKTDTLGFTTLTAGSLYQGYVVGKNI